MARVLRPGGRVVIIELTDMSDDAPHVFPWTEAEWRSCFNDNGFDVTRTVGEQYTPILRSLKAIHRLAHRTDTRARIDAMKDGAGSGYGGVNMVAVRAALLASYPVEEVARFLPSRFAKTTGFLLQREQ
jgi:hypothetical protein